MKQYFGMLLLLSTLSGCAYEVSRPIYSEEATSSCKAQQSNCFFHCKEKNLNNVIAVEECNRSCEQQFTTCLQPMPVIVEQESPVVIESSPSLLIGPYPLYRRWKSPSLWHPHYYHYYHRR